MMSPGSSTQKAPPHTHTPRFGRRNPVLFLCPSMKAPGVSEPEAKDAELVSEDGLITRAEPELRWGEVVVCVPKQCLIHIHEWLRVARGFASSPPARTGSRIS